LRSGVEIPIIFARSRDWTVSTPLASLDCGTRATDH
jgi:hypothetical protein